MLSTFNSVAFIQAYWAHEFLPINTLMKVIKLKHFLYP